MKRRKGLQGGLKREGFKGEVFCTGLQVPQPPQLYPRAIAVLVLFQLNRCTSRLNCRSVRTQSQFCCSSVDVLSTLDS